MAAVSTSSRIKVTGVAGTTSAVLALALALTGQPAATAAPNASYVQSRIIKDSRVVESSGLARSTHNYPETLYTHNDSGDSPRLFAVGWDGATKATLTISGASAVDWEDIASGPSHTLWIGDIGDNGRSRSTISVYRVTEPSTMQSRTLPATRYNFTYADGRHDAEALLVHPTTGRVYVVSKSASGAAIYAAPATLSTSRTNVLTKVAGAPATVTAGSFHPDGKRLVLGNYSQAYFYRSLGSTPVVVKKPSTRQGESLEINRAGSRVFVGSEGSQSPVYAMQFPAGF